VVCVIGSNIAIPGVLARAAQVLADNKINVNCVSQSLRQINMQFVIDRSDYKKAIAALNKALCLEPITAA
jgi:aspartate kinase